MKFKKSRLMVLLVAMFLLVSCRLNTEFNGSRTGNDDQFIMSYDILNIEDHQELNLKKSDKVVGKIDNKSGEITVKILNEEKEEFLKESYTKETDQFTFEAPESGKYIFSVSGEKAKGKVSFVKK